MERFWAFALHEGMVRSDRLTINIDVCQDTGGADARPESVSQLTFFNARSSTRVYGEESGAGEGEGMLMHVEGRPCQEEGASARPSLLGRIDSPTATESGD